MREALTMTRSLLTLVALVLTACDDSHDAPPLDSHPHPAGLTVFLGDSLTSSWDVVPPDGQKLRDLVPGEINAGAVGQASIDMLERLQHDVLDKHPARVVILAGTNDVGDFLDGGPAIEYGPVIDMILRLQAGGVRVILCTIPPLGNGLHDYGSAGPLEVAQWNVTVKAIARAYGVAVVDYWSAMTLPDGEQITGDFVFDGIHPDAAGYAAMWKALKPLLSESGS
ncbi:MAG TPA: GDSL-type esterase/lipase family protein [Steroidobacteraceae bacterium]|nr:GDSL-type esterase/lipase family protein [Steroidobacteraceae bacterium]